MNVVNGNFRAAAQAAKDDPADLQYARDNYARHMKLPLSAETELTLRKIIGHEQEIARHAQQIHLLRLSLETI